MKRCRCNCSNQRKAHHVTCSDCWASLPPALRDAVYLAQGRTEKIQACRGVYQWLAQQDLKRAEVTP
jgi:hypothetical protein